MLLHIEKNCGLFCSLFNHLDIYTQLHQCATVPPVKPDCFDEMKSLAERLSADLPAVRVDLYEVDGKIYFGEYTFFHEAGFTPFIPDRWNCVFGDWLQLPENS